MKFSSKWRFFVKNDVFLRLGGSAKFTEGSAEPARFGRTLNAMHSIWRFFFVNLTSHTRKIKNLVSLKKYFVKSITYLVISIVNTLVSRNFCQNRMRVNFRNFHTVNWFQFQGFFRESANQSFQFFHEIISNKLQIIIHLTNFLKLLNFLSNVLRIIEKIAWKLEIIARNTLVRYFVKITCSIYFDSFEIVFT